MKTAFSSQSQWQCDFLSTFNFLSTTPDLQGILRFPEYSWNISSKKKYTR